MKKLKRFKLIFKGVFNQKNKAKLGLGLAIIAASALLASKQSKNESKDYSPEVYTCGTALGAFQVSSEQVKVELKNGVYKFDNGAVEITISQSNCVVTRNK